MKFLLFGKTTTLATQRDFVYFQVGKKTSIKVVFLFSTNTVVDLTPEQSRTDQTGILLTKKKEDTFCFWWDLKKTGHLTKLR